MRSNFDKLLSAGVDDVKDSDTDKATGGREEATIKHSATPLRVVICHNRHGPVVGCVESATSVAFKAVHRAVEHPQEPLRGWSK